MNNSNLPVEKNYFRTDKMERTDLEMEQILLSQAQLKGKSMIISSWQFTNKILTCMKNIPPRVKGDQSKTCSLADCENKIIYSPSAISPQ